MTPQSPIANRAPRTWHRIRIRVDPRMTEAVAGEVAVMTGTGVEISPAGEKQAGETALLPAEQIIAYIAAAAPANGRDGAGEKMVQLQQVLAEVHRFFSDCPAPILDSEIITEEDWSAAWKKFFTVFQITPHLIIKPSWEDAGEQAGTACIIEMDPGLAFGTGHHASTQLALLLLEEVFFRGTEKPERVLDVGTGTGILAMACGLFGAGAVLALDNDPDAVAAAVQNIRRNNLADRVNASTRDLAEVAAAFDLVAANITHDILAHNAEILARCVNQGGFLVLSGILKGEQETSMEKIFGRLGLQPVKRLARDEWAALLLQKL